MTRLVTASRISGIICLLRVRQHFGISDASAHAAHVRTAHSWACAPNSMHVAHIDECFQFSFYSIADTPKRTVVRVNISPNDATFIQLIP